MLLGSYCQTMYAIRDHDLGMTDVHFHTTGEAGLVDS